MCPASILSYLLHEEERKIFAKICLVKSINCTWINSKVSENRVHKVPSLDCDQGLLWLWAWHILSVREIDINIFFHYIIRALQTNFGWSNVVRYALEFVWHVLWKCIHSRGGVNRGMQIRRSVPFPVKSVNIFVQIRKVNVNATVTSNFAQIVKKVTIMLDDYNTVQFQQQSYNRV